MSWWQRKQSMESAIFLPGTLPPRWQEVAAGLGRNVSVTQLPAKEQDAWAAQLTHPDWGAAEVRCRKQARPLPPELLSFSRELTKEERDGFLSGRAAIRLTMPSTRDNVLRDRKNLLRMARMIMGDDGVGMLDRYSMRFWPRDGMDDELGHDADLDVSQILSLHHVAAADDNRLTWVHSHGLAEIGAIDFDILDPTEDIGTIASDLLRAIAFAILDGDLGASTARYRLFVPKGDVRTVEIGAFLNSADDSVLALRAGADETHNRDRCVLCEPATGLLGRFRTRPRPSRLLSRPMGDEVMFSLSTAATQLTEQRAKGTYAQLRRFAAEFADLELPTIVKLGYRTDGGGPDDREHMWFSVHSLEDEHVDATLESPPMAVSRLKLKQRGRHPVELMSDWAIMTPAGMITPRSFAPVKAVRKHRSAFEKALAERRGR